MDINLGHVTVELVQACLYGISVYKINALLQQQQQKREKGFLFKHNGVLSRL